MNLRAQFDDDGRCQILDSAGNELSAFETVYSRPFNSQYPPPLSPDDSMLYVGTWERGLFCYRVSDGALAWRQGPGKVRRIFPVDGCVVTEMADRGLYRRAQDSGELTGIVKMGGISCTRRLSETRLFVGPWRLRYFIFELPSLSPVGALPERLLNPDRCLSLCIREVSEVDGQLLVEGWDEYPSGDYKAKGQREFVRRVRPGPVDASPEFWDPS